MKNIYKTIGKYVLALSCVAALNSCESFLSVRPSKSSNIVPSTYEDMESILAGMWRNDNISANLIFGGGDLALSYELEGARVGSYDVQTVQAATWERKENGTNKDYHWMYRYQNIFRSNLVLSKLDEIDITEAEYQRLKSKACFRRAYSFMELLNVYTLPYCEENLEEMGLVLSQSPSFDYSVARASLKDTYAFVEEDIKEALKIDVDLTAKAGQGSVYRVTKAAANALASRFYLMKNDYVNAKKYAEEALNLYGEENIMDYNAIGYADRVDNGSIEIGGETIEFEVKYPATEYGYDLTNEWTENYWIGTAGSAFSMGFTTDCLPSESLIECFDADGPKEEDGRFKYFYVQNYCYLNGRPIDVPFIMHPYTYCITVPEMLLTVAECEAREGDWNEAMNIVNRLRAKRIDPSGNVNLSASDRDDAIAKVLRERRRETGPFNRLFDIRRYNANDYPADDVTITQKFYAYSSAGVDVSSQLQEYVLKPGDRKIAAQIPESDILAGRGELKQNTY